MKKIHHSVIYILYFCCSLCVFGISPSPDIAPAVDISSAITLATDCALETTNLSKYYLAWVWLIDGENINDRKWIVAWYEKDKAASPGDAWIMVAVDMKGKCILPNDRQNPFGLGSIKVESDIPALDMLSAYKLAITNNKHNQLSKHYPSRMGLGNVGEGDEKFWVIYYSPDISKDPVGVKWIKMTISMKGVVELVDKPVKWLPLRSEVPPRRIVVRPK